MNFLTISIYLFYKLLLFVFRDRTLFFVHNMMPMWKSFWWVKHIIKKKKSMKVNDRIIVFVSRWRRINFIINPMVIHRIVTVKWLSWVIFIDFNFDICNFHQWRDLQRINFDVSHFLILRFRRYFRRTYQDHVFRRVTRKYESHFIWYIKRSGWQLWRNIDRSANRTNVTILVVHCN